MSISELAPTLMAVVDEFDALIAHNAELERELRQLREWKKFQHEELKRLNRELVKLKKK